MIGELNGQAVKVVTLRGEFVWHHLEYNRGFSHNEVNNVEGLVREHQARC